MRCPRCVGTGKLLFFHMCEPRKVEMACGLCHGCGEVDDRYAARPKLPMHSSEVVTNVSITTSPGLTTIEYGPNVSQRDRGRASRPGAAHIY